jgi:fatty-acid peroxygenase
MLPEYPLKEIPRDNAFDSLLAFSREGYQFARTRFQKFSSDAFACRLLLSDTIFIGGPDAARIFYDTSLFKRAGVVPLTIRKTLLGDGGIHGLDGQRHRDRKAMYLSFSGPQCLQRFRDIAERHWSRYMLSARGSDVAIFDDIAPTLLGMIAAFAGVPVRPEEAKERARDLALMVDAFGSIGPRNWKGVLARKRSEKWMRRVVREQRSGLLAAEPGTALDVLASFRNQDGQLFDDQTAAVELLNVLRPIMATLYFIEFIAAILFLKPALREPVSKDADYRNCFIQEVRRYYPFTPLLGAYTCSDVPWNNYVIPRATLTLLDVYGIHHDARIWRQPGHFDPVRFQNWPNDPYTLIQQGGGLHSSGHRCPGEWLTLCVLDLVSRSLASTDYRASTRHIEFDWKRIPGRLRSPVILRYS